MGRVPASQARASQPGGGPEREGSDSNQLSMIKAPCAIRHRSCQLRGLELLKLLLPLLLRLHELLMLVLKILLGRLLRVHKLQLMSSWEGLLKQLLLLLLSPLLVLGEGVGRGLVCRLPARLEVGEASRQPPEYSLAHPRILMRQEGPHLAR